MSVSAQSEEVSTVIIRGNASGTENEFELDNPDEDREIVGYELGTATDESGADIMRGRAHAFIGTDPRPAPGEDADIGSKFYARARHVLDGINGYSYQFDSEEPVESELTWDWNEDAVLTLVVNEGQGTLTARFQLIVYYVER